MVTAKEFVEAWQKSSSHKEVAEKLGIKANYAATRASVLRKKGVPLRYYKLHAQGNDWEELARLAKELEDDEETGN